MSPNTNDINIVLEELLKNKDFTFATDNQKVTIFKQTLTEYLLCKMICFNLNCRFYTIDNDFKLIIESLNELLDSEQDKFIFFQNIILLLAEFISQALRQKVIIKPTDDRQLSNNPYFKQKDGYLEYNFYLKDKPYMIIINLYDFIENNLEDKYPSYQKYIQ